MNQLQHIINAAQSSNSRLKKTKMKTNLHLLSRGAVFFAASSSLSLPSVVSAAASSDDLQLQPTRRQSSNSYSSSSNHRALMRDEQPSEEEEPDVASIINGTATGGPLSYQVGLSVAPRKLPGCGGSIIAPRVVLTAAHCVVDKNGSPTSMDKVLINGYGLLSGAIPDDSGYIAARSYIAHPDFNYATAENDIALWFLPFPLGEDENFKFATLNEDDNVPAVGEELFVSGWGKTSPLPISPVLLGTNVDYVSNEQCQSDYDKKENPPNTITEGMLCAAGDGTGTCQGDSGGPLMIANGGGPAMDPTIQVGIVSWARGCADPNYPTVYTRVSHYVDWIRSTACQQVGELCPSSSKSSKSKSSSKNDRP